MANEIINDIMKKEIEIDTQKKAIKSAQDQIKMLRNELKRMNEELTELVDEAKMNGVVNNYGEILKND